MLAHLISIRLAEHKPIHTERTTMYLGMYTKDTRGEVRLGKDYSSSANIVVLGLGK